MNFKDANKIQDVIQSLRLAVLPVANNRTKINAQFNGEPPWSEAERQANKIFTNANWLEGSRIAHNARGQLNNAFLKPGNFFNISVDRGPVWQRQRWGSILTEEINKLLKRSQNFKSYFEATNAQVVLHGIGPGYWSNAYDPIPTELGVEDVLVAAGSLVSLRNMGFFAIYREWTYAELYNMTHGSQVDPGWNMELVDALLKSLYESSLQPIYSGNRWLMPEKLEEDIKENAGWFLSSSAPKVYCWDFYFESDEEENGKKLGWQRRIVIDTYQTQPVGEVEALKATMNDSFLYDSSKKGKSAFAEERSNIIHWQFGNCSNVAPFRYYSVRSMGYLLYAVCLWQDRLRCRLNDAVYESLMMYFRNVGEDDRERIEKIDLWHLGIIPDGVSMVPQSERHTVDPDLALLQLSQNRQLMSESSASYLPDVERGGRKTPETATAEMIRLNTSVALTGAMLNQCYENVEYLYREVCRRFCIKDSKHPMVQKLRARLVEREVPLEVLDDVEAWDVQPNRVLGGGNQAMEVLQADRLMAIRPTLDPQAQRRVTKMYVAANSNSDIAEALVPEQQPVSTSTTVIANLAMGTLMDALPFQPPMDINPIEYVGSLIQLSSAVVNRLPAIAQVPSGTSELASKLAGLNTVFQHLEPMIQFIAQDPQMQQQAKAFEDAVKQMIQATQPFVKMLEQQTASQGAQVDPEKEQMLQFKEREFQQKMQIETAKAAQKMEHKDASFNAELQRRNAKTAAEIREQGVRTMADIEKQDLETEASIVRQQRESEMAPKKLTANK